jgi:hypothetical protein
MDQTGGTASFDPTTCISALCGSPINLTQNGFTDCSLTCNSNTFANRCCGYNGLRIEPIAGATGSDGSNGSDGEDGGISYEDGQPCHGPTPTPGGDTIQGNQNGLTLTAPSGGNYVWVAGNIDAVYSTTQAVVVYTTGTFWVTVDGCTSFIDVASIPPANVPTLPEWGLIISGILMLLVGVYYIWKS